MYSQAHLDWLFLFISNMKEEIWKNVVGYEGCYQVSDLGRVRSLDRVTSIGRRYKGKMLKPAINCGYLLVNLYSNGKAEAFLNHVSCGHTIVVDHIDNNPLNNNLTNLQLISQRQNTSKDRVGGTSRYVGVSFNKQGNKFVAKCFHNKKLKHLGCFTTELEASEAYNDFLKTIN